MGFLCLCVLYWKGKLHQNMWHQYSSISWETLVLKFGRQIQDRMLFENRLNWVLSVLNLFFGCEFCSHPHTKKSSFGEFQHFLLHFEAFFCHIRCDRVKNWQSSVRPPNNRVLTQFVSQARPWNCEQTSRMRNTTTHPLIFSLDDSASRVIRSCLN